MTCWGFSNDAPAGQRHRDNSKGFWVFYHFDWRARANG